MKRKGISAGLKLKVLERDKFTCQYCGKRAHERPLEIDHVIPVSKGGTNDFDNLITACRECNRGKKDRVLKEIPLEKRVEVLESSVAELADAIGVHEITVRRWELGERSPDTESLKKLSQVLGVSSSELMGEDTIPITVEKNEKNEKTVPNMAYWGGVLDNAHQAVKAGQNLKLIYSLLADAAGTVKAAMTI